MTSTPPRPEDNPAFESQTEAELDRMGESSEPEVVVTDPNQGTDHSPVTASAPVAQSNYASEQSAVDEAKKVTRAGMVWTATVAGLIMLVLLIIFIVQNQDQVTLKYFGLSAEVSLGLALFIAAVAGGILAAIAGAVRIIQLRHMARKNHRNHH